MNAYIHIPKPCNENWNNMLPENEGRHCLKCSKTVIDFTDWEAPEITAYLTTHADTKVCGRFRQTQLDEPLIEAVERIYHANLSMLKKIAAVFVIAFGLAISSCNPASLAKIQNSTSTVTGDTIYRKGKIKTIPAPDPDEAIIFAGEIQFVP